MSLFTFRSFVALAGVTLGAACVAPPPQDLPCPQPEACLMADFMAAELQKDVGREIGEGVTVRNVQSAGALLVFDLNMPIAAAPLETVQKRIVHEVAAAAFAEGFCGNPEAEEVFQFGNQFQLRSFGTDNVPIGASTLQSCGG